MNAILLLLSVFVLQTSGASNTLTKKQSTFITEYEKAVMGANCKSIIYYLEEEFVERRLNRHYKGNEHAFVDELHSGHVKGDTSKLRTIAIANIASIKHVKVTAVTGGFTVTFELTSKKEVIVCKLFLKTDNKGRPLGFKKR